MTDNYEIIPAANLEIIEESGVNILLQQIRSQWQVKNLIQRVKSLLQVDPNSTCQRISE